MEIFIATILTCGWLKGVPFCTGADHSWNETIGDCREYLAINTNPYIEGAKSHWAGYEITAVVSACAPVNIGEKIQPA